MIYGLLCPGRVLFLNCYESNPLWILLSNTPIKPDAYNESEYAKLEHKLYTDGIFNLTYDSPIESQYLAIKQFDTGGTVVSMNICEIDIYGTCADYFFGEDCLTRCHCRVGSCDTVSGKCLKPEGCEAGWLGDTCSEPCQMGYYGPQCKWRCNECWGQLCHNEDGLCFKGCAHGLNGENCSQREFMLTF